MKEIYKKTDKIMQKYQKMMMQDALKLSETQKMAMTIVFFAQEILRRLDEVEHEVKGRL